MENRGLLFIPDISGFSRFVNAVEIEHSRFIIQQLAEPGKFNPTTPFYLTLCLSPLFM